MTILFGLQPQVKMLAYAGIETKSIGEFVVPVAKKKKKKNPNEKNIRFVMLKKQ